MGVERTTIPSMPRSARVIVIRLLELSGAVIGEIVETPASAASGIVGGEESLGNVVTEQYCIVLAVTRLDPQGRRRAVSIRLPSLAVKGAVARL